MIYVLLNNLKGCLSKKLAESVSLFSSLFRTVVMSIGQSMLFVTLINVTMQYMWQLHAGHKDVVYLLLQYSANIHATDSQG